MKDIYYLLIIQWSKQNDGTKGENPSAAWSKTTVRVFFNEGGAAGRAKIVLSLRECYEQVF